MKLSSIYRRSVIAGLVALLSLGAGLALAAPANAAPLGPVKMFTSK